jgi:hypothetical protein
MACPSVGLMDLGGRWGGECSIMMTKMTKRGTCLGDPGVGDWESTCLEKGALLANSRESCRAARFWKPR